MAGRFDKVFACFLIVLLLTFVWAAMATTFTLEAGDFGAFYTGGLIAKSGSYASLHDTALQSRIQQSLLPSRQSPVFFVRPHLYAAVLSGLAIFPIRTAFAIWITFLALILTTCGFWAYSRFGIDSVVLASLFPAAILSIGFGQDVVVFVGLFVLSYCFFERGRPLLSGCILGLCFVKPHLMLLFPLVLCFQRRWRVLMGFVISGVAEGIVSLWLGGFEGAVRYLEFIRSRNADLSPTPERMMNVQAIALNLGAEHTALAAGLTIFVISAVLIVSWRSEWSRGYAAASVGTLLIAPHTYLYEAVNKS